MKLLGDARRRRVLERVQLDGEKMKLERQRDDIRRRIAEALRLADPIERRTAVKELTEQYDAVVAAWRSVSSRAAAVRAELEGRA